MIEQSINPFFNFILESCHCPICNFIFNINVVFIACQRMAKIEFQHWVYPFGTSCHNTVCIRTISQKEIFLAVRHVSVSPIWNKEFKIGCRHNHCVVGRCTIDAITVSLFEMLEKYSFIDGTLSSLLICVAYAIFVGIHWFLVTTTQSWPALWLDLHLLKIGGV